ncbi:universal stress protein [Maribacter stanieri]|uniref:Nucleotide-binding universal stress protein, UspA family n=1 Tax=Maribacter stanieri TaxID=440514 RepID=A0A1I6IIM0_9FLAO|nr:universal stress protein [Maribacter stanieri]SFR66566.1 Nucleotide-binding universal stress protein, UspA family [Maribacter stanieri]
MKTILYATDYSENSVSALKFAHILAKKFNAKLIIMHVFEIPITLASTVTLTYLKKEKKHYVKNRKMLKDFFAQYIGEPVKNLNLNFVVDEENSVTNSLLEKAIKLNVDLICVGAKGTSAVKEFLLGNTAISLLKKSPCTLMIVPQRDENTQLNKMIYATDFESADVFAINKLAKIAKKFDAQIRVVHITTGKKYEIEAKMEWFKENVRAKVNYAKIEFDLIFSENILEDLLWYLENNNAGIVAMLERKNSTFYEKHFQLDKVKQMAKRSTVPLISFNIGGL